MPAGYDHPLEGQIRKERRQAHRGDRKLVPLSGPVHFNRHTGGDIFMDYNPDKRHFHQFF